MPSRFLPVHPGVRHRARRRMPAPIRIATVLAALGLFACVASDPPASEPAASSAESDPVATSLDLRVEPFTDFYFWVRAQAGEVVPVVPAFQPIIDAWMPVQEQRGAWGGFWRFDLAGMLATSPEEFGAWFDEREQSVPSRRGGEIPIRAPGQAMAAAMVDVWPLYLDQHWPARRDLLLRAKEDLEREFIPRHQEAFRYMLDSLSIEDPRIELPTYLALDIHPPGASTYRTNEGAAAVLSTRELLSEGRFSDLAETVLHESTHALDLASPGDGDAFTRLRARLEERGIERGSRLYQTVPHMIMFVQSEETMRRLYDPDHVAYGDTQRGDIAPLYERNGEPAAIVRREWRRHLDGEADLEQTLERIADLVAN